MDSFMMMPKRNRNGMSPPTPVESPSLAAANARLRSLPVTEQTYIAGKYYGGAMPWTEEAGG